MARQISDILMRHSVYDVVAYAPMRLQHCGVHGNSEAPSAKSDGRANVRLGSDTLIANILHCVSEKKVPTFKLSVTL